MNKKILAELFYLTRIKNEWTKFAKENFCQKILFPVFMKERKQKNSHSVIEKK